ncbi:ornithine carbamoyltransferase [Fonsecaea monophora]|uniref:Ornithine carbamoyltransferase n=1 Tax=Fonsecaea monophora TaxID=254056 RepID=A0A177FGE6_9EURO|nr:ornithine carbamoyltransferase [Fonsecaea monophora]KAH0843126.1 hypothetical protein FOPE_08199 [Fonsecaea pedrosoi]OAG42249.1 ornithine carbamoyltransferase [Fonsecaea monophora]
MAKFEVPPGATAQVRIIDSSTRMTFPPWMFIKPKWPGFDLLKQLPSWSFLVEHTSASGKHSKLVFDLGMPKDWANMAPVISEQLKAHPSAFQVTHDVSEILENNDVKLNEVNWIVWSHWHSDHIGDPALFPPETTLVVGPGFKENLLPGYPANKESSIRECDYTGRELYEPSFTDLKIGDFDANDFFGDGSFYLLSAPGHTVAHLAALVRTTTNPDTFILMGADTCHHGGEVRPSPYLPIPAEITPHPFPSQSALSVCPGAIFENALRRLERPVDGPFFDAVHGHSLSDIAETIAKTQIADADPNVFFIAAHDDTIQGVVDLFPKSANAWKKQGWAEKVKWKFLKDFEQAVKAQSE